MEVKNVCGYVFCYRELCDIAGLPAKIKFTAVILMLRFYVNQSVTSHDPGVLMFTCAFLASKVEEFHRVRLKQMVLITNANKTLI